MPIATDLTLRAAAPHEYEQLDDLTVAAYVGQGLVAPDAPYVAQLRSARRRARDAELIAAVDGSGQPLGSITLCWPGTPLAEIAQPGEAELRMLAVAASARGRGVAGALVGECVARARRSPEGYARLVCSVQDRNAAAHRLYLRLGFTRLPERDWSPAPAVRLLGYALSLTPPAVEPVSTVPATPSAQAAPAGAAGAAGAAAQVEPAYCDQCGQPGLGRDHGRCAQRRALEPPRHCGQCGRRMVVQVTPRGWVARCARHGTSTSTSTSTGTSTGIARS